MATDGLWYVISNEDVVSIMRDTVKEPAMCSKRLAIEASERGSAGDFFCESCFPSRSVNS